MAADPLSAFFVSIGVSPLIGGVLLGVLGTAFVYSLRRRPEPDLLAPARASVPKRSGRPPAAVGSTPELPPAVLAEVEELLASDNKIGAIKIVRQATGLGLKESKDLVESLER